MPPTEWIKAILAQPAQAELVSTSAPFWSVPDNEKPFFMQVVIPMQNEDWKEMKNIATLWTSKEKSSADAWYYLGFAQFKSEDTLDAKGFFKKALELNPKHFDSLLELINIAVIEKNKEEFMRVVNQIFEVDADYAEFILKKYDKTVWRA